MYTSLNYTAQKSPDSYFFTDKTQSRSQKKHVTNAVLILYHMMIFLYKLEHFRNLGIRSTATETQQKTEMKQTV